ncbi:MAG TPA: ATP-binding protein [Opitutaceae bacterium]
MQFLVLRLLTHSELGFFHQYRRQGLEKAKQRAINFDGVVVDRVFPAAGETDEIPLQLEYLTSKGKWSVQPQVLKRQAKNWRLTGDCVRDTEFGFVRPGCLFVLDVDSGQQPAVGRWTVLPADHAATRAILHDADSSGLANASMVALHQSEAAGARTILAKRCPAFLQTPNLPAENMSASAGRKKLTPVPVRLFDLLAAVGHDLPSAVCDLIDNSIAADARTIEITFARPDLGHGRWMVIKDDGSGMSPDELDEAMRIGTDREYENNDLGKYGYGLKGASWSQAQTVVVVTKPKRGKGGHLIWDREHLKTAKDWEPYDRALEKWEADETRIAEHGTAVLWAKMRPPVVSVVAKGMTPFDQEITDLHRRIGLVFHRFIHGTAKGRPRVVIKINGRAVAPNNPVGHKLTKTYDQKDVVIPIEDGEDGRVRVQAFLIPTEEAVLKSSKPAEVQGELDALRLWGKANESQGFFIYRCDRLICWGGWQGLFTLEEKTKLARIAIDFDQKLDARLRVNISKREVLLPHSLTEPLKDIASKPRAASRDAYKKKRQPTSQKPENPAPASAKNALPPEPPTGGPPSKSSNGKAPDVRTVTTGKFLWRVHRGFGGQESVEVSDASPHLATLAKVVTKDAAACVALASFLRELDGVGAQAKLLEQQAR